MNKTMIRINNQSEKEQIIRNNVLVETRIINNKEYIKFDQRLLTVTKRDYFYEEFKGERSAEDTRYIEFNNYLLFNINSDPLFKDLKHFDVIREKAFIEKDGYDIRIIYEKVN